MKKYVCSICGFVYDEAKGIPESGIKPGTKWEELPEDWKCPLCGAPKSAFTEQENQKSTDKSELNEVDFFSEDTSHTELREMTFAELSAVCSNLAKGCEKQYLSEESELFVELAKYYAQKSEQLAQKEDFSSLIKTIEKNLNEDFPKANMQADSAYDRGAKRALTWSEKVSRIQASLLVRYEKEGNSMIEGTKVWICEICGFIFLGDVAPEICPICKVPNVKIVEVS